ncbi:hypothetical protein SAMN04488074_117110 [Lentzea albidocapillata subsp. violacea]|uniref:Uncharacterized protein n=1 Tax=Lentzea albidocapillata subsp. violacea TaxID=128104 RepID=A0A1G9QZU5_9PSEU|nr:hypothetical protein [Lentzea albidocapillata]SDM16117.1 hypothetical protein SAMN04488074_117110 [Lentzea albidocapillata subsp. violacea]
MSTALTEVACPVCTHVVPPDPSCGRCGWVLFGGPWVDIAADDRRLEFHAELTAARRRFDLTAAVLAAGGDQELLARLLKLLRGGAPKEAELADARRTSARHRTEPLAVAGAAALSRLARHGALAVVDVRLDGVAVARIDVGERHVPGLTGPVRLHPWRELMPTLPQDADELAIVLAGGAGLGQATRHTGLADLGLDGDVLVLNRLPGLPVPDALVSRYTDVWLVARTEPALDDRVIASWVARAPLHHDLSLVLVDVDPQGVTHPMTRTLFTAGTTARELPVARLTVDAPAGGREPLVLAVVSGPAGTPPRQCAPISVVRCELRPSQRHELEFRLDGPGEVTLVRPGGSADDATANRWPELLDDMPPRYQSDADALDFAIAVELGGAAEAVAPRRKLVVDVLAHLSAHHPDPAAVRAAVIGYDDHLRARNVLHTTSGFVSLEDAEDFAAALLPSPAIEPRGAPVEDALAVARGLPWRSLPVARRLVLVGGRPPHPAADAAISRCPNQHDWQFLLRQLESDRVVHAAIWDRPDWTERGNPEARRATQAWHALASPQRPMLLHHVDAAFVVKEAKAVRDAGPQASLLFPLAIKN